MRNWFLPFFIAGVRCACVFSETAHLPFDLLPSDSLRAYPKKVFAHYFTPFPISIDNQDSSVDYYTTQLLSPTGENSKYYDQGGYLRERPLPRPVRPEANWYDLDMREEVRRAIAMGIDGFVLCVLTLDHTHFTWHKGESLMRSAAYVDTGFKIMLMPTMDNTGSDEEVKTSLADAVEELSAYPSVFKLADGRVVVCPWELQLRTPPSGRRFSPKCRHEMSPLPWLPT